MNTLSKTLFALVLALPLAAQARSDLYTDAEIDQLIAPIALYPDSVLSQVLAAATYPDEVEEAARWSRNHPEYHGQEAVEEVDDMDWHASVKALVAFPEVLARMHDDPDWTEDLGNAFAGQESDVMDRVQYLRDRADESGSLDRLEHTRVVREREYIYLEPSYADVVYVPYYDPWYAYGSWWWPGYPPHCWTYWGGRPVTYYSGFYWGIGFHVGPAFVTYNRFDWPARRVVSGGHRFYAPSPGYSGGSDRRQPHGGWRNAPEDRRPHDPGRHELRDSRPNDRMQRHGGTSWRDDSGWRGRGRGGFESRADVIVRGNHERQNRGGGDGWAGRVEAPPREVNRGGRGGGMGRIEAPSSRGTDRGGWAREVQPERFHDSRPQRGFGGEARQEMRIEGRAGPNGRPRGGFRSER